MNSVPCFSLSHLGFWPETSCGFRSLLPSQRPSPCGLGHGLEDQALRLELCEFPCPCFSHTCKMGCSQPRLPRPAVRAGPLRHRAGPGTCRTAPITATLVTPFSHFSLALRSAPPPLLLASLFLSPVGVWPPAHCPLWAPRHQSWSFLCSALCF